MVFLDKQRPRTALLLVLLTAVVNVLLFAFLFGFHPNNDTDSYLYAIHFFRGTGTTIFPNRYLNPFYPVVATYILFFVSPVQALITTNIIFYFALVLLTYGLVRRVLVSRRAGYVAAVMTMTAYPMLRYALTQVQDIGGYVWYVATLYAGWRWYENRDSRWLHLAGVSVAFGVLTKESGCMGALFVGMLVLFARLGIGETIKNFCRIAWAPFLTIIINADRGHDMGYSSLRWFLDNWTVYAAGNYHAIKWLGVNLSTFNILWFFCILSIVMLMRKRWVLPKQASVYCMAVLLPSASYFAWPIFISRTVFIAAWLIIPLAAYGLCKISERSRWLFVGLLAIVAVTPYIMQSVLRYAHVFKIYDDCQASVSCSWQYFWSHRSTFSTES